MLVRIYRNQDPPTLLVGWKMVQLLWEAGWKFLIRLNTELMLVVKNPPPNVGDLRDTGSIPGSGKSPGGGHGNPLQYSCQENPRQRSLVG